MTAVSGGSISTTFSYDPNGNQTSGLGRTISYSSYNKPSSITQGARTISFLDDTEHQRFKQVTPEGATLYIAAFGVLAELSSPGASGQKWTDYLSVGNAMVGMRVIQTAAETISTRYFHTDHLGSISVITNENGVVQERLSYDAWGKRRNANGADDVTGSITSQTTRGFTGEEELSVSGLVHLNGRVYDPLLARFTSADTMTESPYDPQDWNRYSYVGNDPLAFTDPSGHCFLGCFWQHIVPVVSSAWHAVTNFVQHNPIVRAVIQVVATVVLNAVLPVAGLGLAASSFGLAVASAAGGAAIATGLSGGNLGQILKAGAIAGVTAAAFFGVGDLTGHTPTFGTAAYAENIAGHALVGCASSVASGGSCESGALSGAVGSALSPVTDKLFPDARTDFGQRIGGTIVEATAGGLASVAGGGKFANGVVTGAFGYLFNYLIRVDGLPLQSPRIKPLFDPLIADKVSDFIQDLQDQGIPVQVTSGFRTIEDQQDIPQDNANGRAKNCCSLHSAGLAFDINMNDLVKAGFSRQDIVESARSYGLQWGGDFTNPSDRVHFYVDPWRGNVAGRSNYIVMQQALHSMWQREGTGP